MSSDSSKPRNPEKCTFIGCEDVGVPQDGFDFYMCDACSKELEQALETEGKRRNARHENN